MRPRRLTGERGTDAPFTCFGPRREAQQLHGSPQRHIRSLPIGGVTGRVGQVRDGRANGWLRGTSGSLRHSALTTEARESPCQQERRTQCCSDVLPPQRDILRPHCCPARFSAPRRDTASGERGAASGTPFRPRYRLAKLLLVVMSRWLLNRGERCRSNRNLPSVTTAGGTLRSDELPLRHPAGWSFNWLFSSSAHASPPFVHLYIGWNQHLVRHQTVR